MNQMYDDNWSGNGGKYFPVHVGVTSPPYNVGSGTWMGKMDDLPDEIWIFCNAYGTASDRTVAWTGWTNNGGYTTTDKIEDIEALDVTGAGDYAAFDSIGFDHLCEFDLHVSLFKR